MYFYDITYIVLGVILLPAIIFAMYASSKINAVYSKNLKVFSQKGVTGKDMARKVLDASNLGHVKIEVIAGKMTDHYDPRTKTVAISEQNANSSSLAALGVVAHEIGHAMQDGEGYAPLKFRNAVIPFTNFVSRYLILLIIFGFVADFILASTAGLAFNLSVIVILAVYALSAFVSIITLPVEYNASKRTEAILVTSGLLAKEEYAEVKSVLNAAALTYVAAAVVSIMQLVRILLYFLANSRRR